MLVGHLWGLMICQAGLLASNSLTTLEGRDEAPLIVVDRQMIVAIISSSIHTTVSSQVQSTMP